MWIARDKNSTLCLYNVIPTMDDEGNWTANPDEDVVKDLDYHYDYLQIDSCKFSDLKFNDNPLKVDLVEDTNNHLYYIKEITGEITCVVPSLFFKFLNQGNPIIKHTDKSTIIQTWK